MNEPDPAPSVRRRRLLYRATHRGTREADILVGGFVTPRLVAFTEAEIGILEVIMDLPDGDLADWLCGRRAIPTDQDGRAMLDRMRAAACG